MATSIESTKMGKPPLSARIDDTYKVGSVVVEKVMHMIRAKELPESQSGIACAYIAGLALIRMMRLVSQGMSKDDIDQLIEIAETVSLKTELSHGSSSKPLAISQIDLDQFSEVLGKEVYLAIFDRISNLGSDLQMNAGILYAAIVCLTTEVSVSDARAEIIREMRKQFPTAH